LLQRQPREDEELRKSDAAGIPELTPDIASGMNTLRGNGNPLTNFVRGYFEPRFGYDFSNVRVHADASSAHLARSVNAQAFTLGRDVVFGAGRYTPETEGGRHLLAHELTHVVQQGQGGEGRVFRAEAAAPAPPAPAAECTVTWASPLPADGKDCTFKRGFSTSPKHDGVDYAMPEGTSLRAAADGTVLQASDRSDGYGNTVLIDHCGKYVTRYGHLSAYKVKKDDKVTKGQAVALSGNTGHSTGPHLHFEIREGGAWGTVLDPKSFITFPS
jgi:murein DD-endopeptidase MepM/ murein hydrolase activator NlpD